MVEAETWQDKSIDGFNLIVVMEPAIPSLTFSVPGGTLGMVICLLHVAV